MLVDLLHLSRNLRRSPASAGAAILILSLTLGAGGSIFAIVHAVLLTPPPFIDPDALVTVGETPVDDSTAAPRAVSYATFNAWRERGGSLAALEAYDATNLTLTGVGAAERVSATDVTPGLLTLLGITPASGRAFQHEDVGRPVVIVSDGFWRGKLAADPAIIGRQIVLGGRAHTILGVLPEEFVFELNRSDLWRLLPITPAEGALGGRRVRVIARLARNVAPGSLAAALDDVSRTASPPARVVAMRIATAISSGATRTLWLLAAAAALAVLIAFTNFAGLLIVRSIDRQRELAVRSALGARRSEIARQLLLEAQALAATGILGGVILALWTTPTIGHLALQQFGGVAHRDVAVNWRVIAVLAIAASACAVMAALPAAVMAGRRSVVDVLRRGVTPPPGEVILRRVLVAGEVALAFVLLVSLTLLGRSLIDLLRVNPGFDARGLLALQVSLPAASYTPDRVVSFYLALQSALQERWGPRAVSIVDELPLTGDGGRRLVRDHPTDTGREAVMRTASPSYFDVMRIPVIAGRSFDGRDDSSAPPRVLISGSLAERLFPSGQTIGRRIQLGPGPQIAEIIGVVGEVRHRALDEPSMPTVYLSGLQAPSPSSVLVVRSVRSDADVIAAVRDEVERLDGNLPVYRVRSMQDVVAASPGVPARRVLTGMFMAFASLALVLGVIGLFGVISHDVATRRAELALRMALGANPLRILSATLGQGAVMVGTGLAVGGLLSIWAARALGGAGFATAGLDALSIGAPATVLMLAGAAAIVPAARRAARTDPLIALRSE